MTNIEAMTIGAKARLQHLLNIDVARHLLEMQLRCKIFTPVVYQLEMLDKLTITVGDAYKNSLVEIRTTDGPSTFWCAATNQPSADMLAVPSTLNAMPSRF